jgi:hypothetical protein
VQEVAVPGVELDAVEAGGLRPAGGVDEALDHPGEVVVGRHLHPVRRGRRRERRHHGGALLGGDHAGQGVGRRRALLRRDQERAALGDVEEAVGAVVDELGGDGGAVAVGVVGQAPQPREVGVVGAGDLPAVGGGDRVRHRHGADDDQTGTPARPCLEPRRLRVAHGAVALRQVHAHRSHGDAVPELERPDPARRQEVPEGGHHSWSA